VGVGLRHGRSGGGRRDMGVCVGLRHGNPNLQKETRGDKDF
jgi:hypothetical protein